MVQFVSKAVNAHEFREDVVAYFKREVRSLQNEAPAAAKRSAKHKEIHAAKLAQASMYLEFFKTVLIDGVATDAVISPTDGGAPKE